MSLLCYDYGHKIFLNKVKEICIVYYRSATACCTREYIVCSKMHYNCAHQLLHLRTSTVISDVAVYYNIVTC
jgi:hypothetical protein